MCFIPMLALIWSATSININKFPVIFERTETASLKWALIVEICLFFMFVHDWSISFFSAVLKFGL